MKHTLITLALLISLAAQGQQVDVVNSDNINSKPSNEWLRDVREFTSNEKEDTPIPAPLYEIENDMFLVKVWSGENGENQRYRDELSDRPWALKGYPLKTEKWIGWRYNVIERQDNEWFNIFQWYQAPQTGGPVISLNMHPSGKHHTKNAIIVRNETKSGSDQYYDTGVTFPNEGEYVDIVLHAVFSPNREGYLQVWLNGELVYDKHEKTMFNRDNNVPNSKVGIYYHMGNNKDSYGDPFKYTLAVPEIRQIMLSPGDNGYGKDLYDLVAPISEAIDPPCECPECGECVEIPELPVNKPCPKGMKMIELRLITTSGGEWEKDILCVPDEK